MRHIKFIWDFYGPDAFETARHHEIHLKDYCRSEDLHEWETGHDEINDSHSVAYLITTEDHLPAIRDQLRPKRAVVA